MPYVSVIIPCYNAAEYITKCLDALQRQSYQNFEVILVDDCSSDNTVEIIREFSAGSALQITLLRNEVNSGPGVSRNHGIQHSQSEYVCFCDSDDWYDPDYLEQMVNACQDGQADLVLCNSRKITPSGNVDVPLFRTVPDSVTAQQVLALGVDSLCCLMVRRRIATSVPQPDLRNGEDMAAIPLMIMQCRKFGFVTKCIYNYLCRTGSLSLTAHAGVTAALEQSFRHITTHQLPGFEQEIAFVGVKNLVYGALLNHFKSQKSTLPAQQLLERFERQYPEWYNNPYLKQLPLFKKLFLFFAKRRWFALLRLMSRVHRLLTEKE